MRSICRGAFYIWILAPDYIQVRCGPIGIYVDIASCSAVGRLPSGESGGLETEVGPRTDLRYNKSLKFKHGVLVRVSPERHIPYSAIVDLVAGLWVSQVQFSFVHDIVSLVITIMRGHIDIVLRLFESSKEVTCSETCSLIEGFHALRSLVLYSIYIKYYFMLTIGECKDGDELMFLIFRVRISNLIVNTPIDVSKIAEAKYPDCDIYVENVILSGDLIALPFECYGVILGMDCCLNITLK
ncbi:hypothetical protein M9H77_36032 [Catharanthus roseus]|uniref:Uncharacterized protein n=1 Tax=Catharanthus roseus TaxID=4058 RepID=A0ACB9ZUX6_CATRO|nr:hypothetical protein M9H77_36032 [Catharanthus roseus]